MLRPLSILLVPLVLAGCIHRGDDRQPNARPAPASGPVTVPGDIGEVGRAYVAGAELHLPGRRSPVRLGSEVNTLLLATLGPAAIEEPRGARVVFNSWQGRSPVLRVHDLRTREESVLDRGAVSFAWRDEGPLAYFKAVRPMLGDPRRYVGHVVVRPALEGAPTRWTTAAARYVVAAWARRSVLYYRLGRGFPDLLVLDGPGRQRLLAKRSALVAVSPDGRRAFVSRYGASPPVVRLLEVASGRELARLEVVRDDVAYVAESGSWEDELVFAPTTTGIAVFRVSGDTIRVEQVLRAGPTFPLGLSEPRAAGGGRKVVAWGQLEPRPRQAIPEAVLVECDRVSLRCVRGAVASSTAPPRPLYNPSRP